MQRKIFPISTFYLFVFGALGCKSTTSSEVSDAAKAESKMVKIDWAKHSDLTHAPIVTHKCSKDSCPTDPQYETGLHREFWRHVHQEDYAGMQAWQNKTFDYTEYSSKRSDRKIQMARLKKLLGFGQGMLLLQYNLHELVAPINSMLTATDLEAANPGFKKVASHPALQHLIMGLGHAVASGMLNNNDLNLQTLMLVVGSFTQATMPPNLLGFTGLTGIQSYLNTIYGPSCRDIKPQDRQLFFGNLCFENGLSGPGRDAYKSCVDAESCRKVGTGTEGIISTAMSLVMLKGTIGAQRALDMWGDGPKDDQIANCDSYWCSSNTYNDPKAQVPEATTTTPFKKIGILLAIAEAYGKVGNLAKMNKVLAATRAEAVRLNYPIMSMIDRVETSLTGGDKQKKIPDMLKMWSNPDPKNDVLGAVQFPLPQTGREHNCVSCHFGGVLHKDVIY